MSRQPNYLKDSISNGNPREQALIRRWWAEEQGSKGLLVWEYYIDGRYADCLWFLDDIRDGQEASGKQSSGTFPLTGRRIVLCEAKHDLNPEVIGQALVYSRFAIAAGGHLEKTIIFSETAS
ncbi:MAG: hypothetical protein MRJ96_04505 [Nitrospirales bacterium]|nr:hypothetical protein [Nitrospira sp.]MDR4500703.1 hypothetical protein [Nitrospirales bacterium]